MLEFDNQVGSEDTGSSRRCSAAPRAARSSTAACSTRTERLIGAFQDMVRARVEPALRSP